LGLIDNEWIDSDKPDTKVDEFEQWKTQQKVLAAKTQIPSDEAPPRTQDEVNLLSCSSLDLFLPIPI
jgi:hypothetical protein